MQMAREGQCALRDDNKFKYMDISQQVPMSKQEVKNVTRNGILENQADAFIELKINIKSILFI